MQPGNEQDDVTFASLWRRLAAYMLDIALILPVMVAVFYVFFGFDETFSAYWENRNQENREKFLEERNLIRNLTFGAWLVYSMIFEASALQGTLGKVICGIKVIDENGQRLTLNTSLWRTLAKIITFLSLGIGFFWAAFSYTRQTWHDLLGRTFVIVRRRLEQRSKAGYEL